MAKAYEAAIAGLSALWAESRLCESLVFKAGGRVPMPQLWRIFRRVFKHRVTNVRVYRGGHFCFGVSCTPLDYRRPAFLWSAAHGAPLFFVFSHCPFPCSAQKTGDAKTTAGTAAAWDSAATSTRESSRPKSRRKSFLQTLLTDYNLLIYRRVLLGV